MIKGRGFAPRGHPEAAGVNQTCPECGSALVGVLGWVWCFNHEHRTDTEPPTYLCDYEARVSP